MLKYLYIQSIFGYKDGNLYNKNFRDPRAIKEAKTAYDLAAQLIHGEYKHEVKK